MSSSRTGRKSEVSWEFVDDFIVPTNDVFEKFYGMIKDTFVEVCLRDQKKNDSKGPAPLCPQMTLG